MIEEDLITYNTAVLAKSKGFDIPCFEYYEKEIPKLYYSNREEEEPYNNEKYIGTFGEDLYEYVFSAPTQSLLAKWLRVNHNIHVSPYRLNNQWCCDVFDITRNCYITSNTFDKNLYDTYEQALEAGLQHALNLI